jgi:hypothetical protein
MNAKFARPEADNQKLMEINNKLPRECTAGLKRHQEMKIKKAGSIPTLPF